MNENLDIDKAPIKVVCGVILNDERKVFLCLRMKEKSMGGYWEFPGGKLENGESYKECLERELLEELDMRVKVEERLITVLHDYGSFKIELIAYYCCFQESSYEMTDHDQYEWVDIPSIFQKNLAPADIPIAECLLVTKSS